MELEALLARKRREYAKSLERALDDCVARLAAMPEVEKVVLFGSYASGRNDLFADLDLLIVMSSEQGFVQRTAKLYQQLVTDVDVDLVVYTPAEFEEQRRHGFVRQALETGKVLYEK